MSATTADDNTIAFDEAFLLEIPKGSQVCCTGVSILRGLHRKCASSFINYMDDWSPYTDRSTLGLRRLMRNTFTSINEFKDELASLLESVGQEATGSSFVPFDADSNYSDWPNLLPRLLCEVHGMVTAWESALSEATGSNVDQEKAAAIRPILEAQLAVHRDTLAQLQDWASKLC